MEKKYSEIKVMKQLRVKNVDGSFSLTTKEVIGWLASTFPVDTPVILKCNNKNFRLASFAIVGNKPVLIGKRGKNDK